jgi:Domain of unknown function (DUF4333)
MADSTARTGEVILDRSQPVSGRCLIRQETPVVLAGLSTALAIVGCGDAATLNNPDQAVSTALYKAVGQHPALVSCPSNIPKKVGHAFRCTITDSRGNKIGATVTETSASGSGVQLRVLVDR